MSFKTFLHVLLVSMILCEDITTAIKMKANVVALKEQIISNKLPSCTEEFCSLRSKDQHDECQLEGEFLVHRCSEFCRLLQRLFRGAFLVGMNLKEELQKFKEKAVNICKLRCLEHRGRSSKVLDNDAHGSFLRSQGTTDAWGSTEREGNSQKRFQVLEAFQDEELREDNSEEGGMEEKRIVEDKRRYNDPVEHCVQKCKFSNLSRLTCLIRECQSANVVLRKKFF